MNMFNGFHQHAALFAGAVLLCTSLAARADDIQEANQLFRQGQHSQALDKVNGLLASNPKDAQARFLRGLILTEQGNTADAIKAFSALTEDYPELPEPYNNLAVLYASQGQYDKARLALEKAIRTHPSYTTAHENLGDIYAKMASQAYDRALQLDRSNPATQTKLAMIKDLFADGAHSKAAPPHNSAAPAIAAEIENKTEPAAPVVSAARVAPVASAVPVASAAPVEMEPAAAKKSTEPAPAVDNRGEVLKTVNAWVAAWSSRDVRKYLSFYSADFKTPAGESRAAWEASRRERISTPKSIRVGISNATVKFSDSDHATVKFRQSYQAKHLKTSSNKTLLMVKSGGKWLIQEEHAR